MIRVQFVMMQGNEHAVSDSIWERAKKNKTVKVKFGSGEKQGVVA